MTNVSSGVAHTVPTDLRETLTSNAGVLEKWNDLTPLARNEWICWTISVKKPETRKEHIERLVSDLKDGKRRPCCWAGCTHRKDKPMSPSQKHVLKKPSKRNDK